ncbi:hypothetical protein [Pseudaminobacter salicylatoxidans]|uniref:hypothetical protein n=1 Tax=Pseudaminobacter salicylatoxidans TaxID=93369 RepID=UPI00047453B5
MAKGDPSGLIAKCALMEVDCVGERECWRAVRLVLQPREHCIVHAPQAPDAIIEAKQIDECTIVVLALQYRNERLGNPRDIPPRPYFGFTQVELINEIAPRPMPTLEHKSHTKRTIGLLDPDEVQISAQPRPKIVPVTGIRNNYKRATVNGTLQRSAARQCEIDRNIGIDRNTRHFGP